jgi:hypothetical protein
MGEIPKNWNKRKLPKFWKRKVKHQEKPEERKL